MILQPIIDVAEICARKGIKDAILSPGSRCAPLTIGFAKHQNIKTKTISDERSAAFIALGIAQKSKNPVALICTSGTAVLNYGPAIAEAYFNHVPLVVITADRPPQWINQSDGQTIFQENVYGKHVKGFFSLSPKHRSQESVEQVTDIVTEAYDLCISYPPGPVHINVPIDEPFYPVKEEKITFSSELKIAIDPKNVNKEGSIPSKYTGALKQYERIL
ncbi:MAG: thiamine pyrophosphate-binding protein, partial [Bacteroidetes bacterium]|nr:thiamine pyrophosphate-binding protein [Bacteroidota bacterium]